MKTAAMAEVTLTRLGRAIRGKKFLERGSTHGSWEQGGGTAADIKNRGTMGTRAQGAGTESECIKLTQRSREAEPQARTGMHG